MESDLYLNDQIKQLEKQMREIDEKLSRMLMMLTGNVLDKNDNGFIGKVAELEKRVDQQQGEINALQKFKAKMMNTAVGVALGVGGGVGFTISKVVELITKH